MLRNRRKKKEESTIEHEQVVDISSQIDAYHHLERTHLDSKQP